VRTTIVALTDRYWRRTVAVTLGLAALALVVFAFQVREVEARLGAFMAQIVTGHPAAAIPGADFFYVLEQTTHTFGLTVTSECTSSYLIAPVLFIGGLMALGRRVQLKRVLLGVGLAAVVLFGLNLFRITMIAWATANYGSNGFTWSHEVLGSGITVLGYVLALTLLVGVARKSSPPVEAA
jgi:exosortase/archaeosortase family protein